MSVSFELPDQDGNLVKSSDFAGRRLIVFFYPKAMTPGCTTEACDFRDSYDELLAAGYDIVGVSPDPPEANAKFKEKDPALAKVFASGLEGVGPNRNSVPLVA